jgi:hypothetical protein
MFAGYWTAAAIVADAGFARQIGELQDCNPIIAGHGSAVKPMATTTKLATAP